MANRSFRTVVNRAIDWAAVLMAIAETIERPMHDWMHADVADDVVSDAVVAVAIEFVEWAKWMHLHCCS